MTKPRRKQLSKTSFMDEYDVNLLAHEPPQRRELIATHLEVLSKFERIMFLGWIQEPNIFTSKVRPHNSAKTQQVTTYRAGNQIKSILEPSHVTDRERSYGQAVYGGQEINHDPIINYQQTLSHFLKGIGRDRYR
jgi:hypothetical protein